MKLNKEKGITLVALIVTIIILIILIAIVVGEVEDDNGLLAKAESAIDIHQTEEEFNKLIIEDTITIGGIEINFPKQTKPLINIGSKVEYSANGEDNWIVFGQTENGDVLITTEEPIETDTSISDTAEGWLDYENTLNEACSVYGSTINGKEIKARSITLDDINKFLGLDKLVDKEEKEIYTFGTEYDYENKKVDYLYPKKGSTVMSEYEHWDDETGDYVVDGEKEVENWMKATNSSEEETFKNEYFYLEFYNNEFYLNTIYYDDENVTSLINADRLEYIFGSNDNQFYYDVATKMVKIYDDDARFRQIYVSDNEIDYSNMIRSYSNCCREDDPWSATIRPIVEIPLFDYINLYN